MMMMMFDVRVKELGPGEIKPSSDSSPAAAGMTISSHGVGAEKRLGSAA